MRQAIFFLLLFMVPVTAAAKGDLQINCIPGIKIFVDSKYMGTSNQDEQGLFVEGLKDGPHYLKASRRGSAFKLKKFFIKPGRLNEVRLYFIKRKEYVESLEDKSISRVISEVGTLELRATPPRPTAVVYLDRRKRGQGQIRIWRVASGKHTVTWRRRGKKLSYVIDLKGGELIRLKADFRTMSVTQETSKLDPKALDLKMEEIKPVKTQREIKKHKRVRKNQWFKGSRPFAPPEIYRKTGRVMTFRRGRKSTGEMVPVPGGWFTMGSNERGADSYPSKRIYLKPFYIDKYEVTVKQYARCKNAGVCEKPATGPSSNWGKGFRGNHPINGVSWYDAALYCKWAGKRLPTEAEWEKAARGTDQRLYPWGNQKPGCKYAVLRDKNGPGCGKNSTWPVGSKPLGVSPYGAHDMAGNVWEWVADWYGKNYYQRRPEHNPKGPAKGSSKVLRGGSWGLTPVVSNSTNRLNNSREVKYQYYGFRCAK